MRYCEVVKLVNEILSGYTMPLTLRQIFYRLVANYNYPNKNSAYNQLSRQLVLARERGDVDETMIEDRSRIFLGMNRGFDNPKDFLSYRVNNFVSSPLYYSRRMWSDQPKFVIVWIEKDALSKVVSTIANTYQVITAPSRGYASYTYVKQATEIFPDNKKIIVLHFADHDPSGLDMTRDLQERFLNYSYKEIEVERVALSYDQIIKYKLAPNPTKTADPRAKEYISQFGNECWELDAIEPSELQRLVSEAIENHIDIEIWNATLEKQEQERQELEKIFSGVIAKLQKMGLL